MPNVKIQCGFCGQTNTRMEPVYASSGFLGLGSEKVGENEVVDNSIASFYRCVGCGRFICDKCCVKLDVFKKKLGLFVTKRWTECPKCAAKLVKLD